MDIRTVTLTNQRYFELSTEQFINSIILGLAADRKSKIKVENDKVLSSYTSALKLSSATSSCCLLYRQI